MKINSSKVLFVEKSIGLTISHNNKKFDIAVWTRDGKVKNPERGVSTSYLTYFNEVPDSVRKKHMEQIVKHVEDIYPDL